MKSIAALFISAAAMSFGCAQSSAPDFDCEFDTVYVDIGSGECVESTGVPASLFGNHGHEIKRRVARDGHMVVTGVVNDGDPVSFNIYRDKTACKPSDPVHTGAWFLKSMHNDCFESSTTPQQWAAEVTEAGYTARQTRRNGNVYVIHDEHGLRFTRVYYTSRAACEAA